MKTDVHAYKINLPLDLMASLKEICAAENRSMSAQIIRFLRRQVEIEAQTQK